MSRTFYHGSSRLFDEFTRIRKPTIADEPYYVPIFVTDQRDFALLHARPSGYLYTLDVDLGKVFDPDDLYEPSRYWPPAPEDLTELGEELWDDIYKGRVFPGQASDEGDADQLLAAIIQQNWDAMEHPSFLRWLQERGYDSFPIRGEHTGQHYGVFDPSRISIRDVQKAPLSANPPVVVRPEGWDAQHYEATQELTRAGYLYRGMTAREYNATVGAGRPVQSTGAYSFGIEGTNFADDFSTAEDYVNFGRDDPRRTGEATYVVEVDPTSLDIRRNRQGYYEAFEPVPLSQVTRVWRLEPQGGAVVAVPVTRTLSTLKRKLLR